jgi:hypothetical protein
MRELNDFFGINWNFGTPDFYIINSRKEIDYLQKRKTQPWMIQWAGWNRNIFLLDREKYTTESSHEADSGELFSCRIKHELCHHFIHIFVDSSKLEPKWLNEGLSDVLSGSVKLKKRPTEVSHILETYDKYSDNGCEYKEGPFVVEALLDKYGREKMLELLKKAVKVRDNAKFKKIFEVVYGFALNYENINELINK